MIVHLSDFKMSEQIRPVIARIESEMWKWMLLFGSGYMKAYNEFYDGADTLTNVCGIIY
jgi:hypothetical protein